MKEIENLKYLDQDKEEYIFVCTNYRPNGKSCFSSEDDELYKQIKVKTAEINANFKDKKVRVCKSSCLGKCKEGPIVLSVPKNIFIPYKTIDDLCDIVSNTFISK